MVRPASGPQKTISYPPPGPRTITVQANRSKHGRPRTPIVLGILQEDQLGAWDGLVWGTGCAVRWGGARVGQPGPATCQIVSSTPYSTQHCAHLNTHHLQAVTRPRMRGRRSTQGPRLQLLPWGFAARQQPPTAQDRSRRYPVAARDRDASFQQGLAPKAHCRTDLCTATVPTSLIHLH